MWFVILGLLLIFTAACFFYLTTRVKKFNFIKKLAGTKKRFQFLVSFLIVAFSAFLIGYSLNLINLTVIALFLTLFWLLCDCMIWIASRFIPSLKTTKIYVGGILTILVTITYLSFAYYTDRHVVITEYNIHSEKPVEPITLAVFSDFHMGTTFNGDSFGKYIDLINNLNPDAVLIAGDFIDGSSKDKDIISACNQLRRLKSKYGTFFVYGNHDKNYYGEERTRQFSTKEYSEALIKNKVRILEDEVFPLSDSYTIIGRQDKVESNRKPISELMKKAPKDSFIIDMNHQPNDYKNESEAGVDLVISGHTHGGQFRLIRNVGVLIGANDRTYGYEKRGNTNFIVSSGISDWAIDFKTGCVSEIVLIKISS